MWKQLAPCQGKNVVPPISWTQRWWAKQGQAQNTQMTAARCGFDVPMLVELNIPDKLDWQHASQAKNLYLCL